MKDISHPDKVLFPEIGATKEDVALFFEKIAPQILPFISKRALTFRIFPEGISEDGFFNKHVPDHFPDSIPRIKLPMKSEGKEQKAIVMAGAEKKEHLVYFAGQNVIEIHTALSCKNSPECPDQVIFDLDPSDNDFEKVRQTGLYTAELLEEHNLPFFIKTTGSRGIHIHIPLQAKAEFDHIKLGAHELAQKLTKRHPDLTTLAHRKDKRGDKVFIDYLRNEYGQTAIAPYCLRAKKGAPVATPIDLDELKDNDVSAQSWTIENIFRRLSQKEDPWKSFWQKAISPESFQKATKKV